MKRKKYLNELWPGYVGFSLCSDSDCFGRITEIGAGFLSVCWNEEQKKIFVDKEVSLAVKGEVSADYSCFDVLRSGDVVSFDEQKKRITLLAPKVSEQLDFYFPSEAEKKWSQFQNEIRSFFLEKKFTEILTPSLVKSPGVEEYLHPFKVGSDVYLPTSPEFHLKKSLASGSSKIFELKPCFRNGEWGKHHRPEFLMLEWYRSFANLDSIVVDIKELISSLLSEDISTRELTVAEAFKEVLDFELKPETSREELFEFSNRINLHVDKDDSWNDLFFRLMMEKIEPWLESLGAVVLKDYPPAQSALARIGSDGWAKRFEFYWRGLEIANAFDELNDPNEQRIRFENTNEKRAELGFTKMPIDEEFLSALEYGMPPSAGIALGVERLFMAIHQIDDIGQVRKFTRPEGLY